MSTPVAENIIPVPVRAALKRKDAAEYLAIGETKLWELVQLGRIKTTSYGTYPLFELDRHLREEIATAAEA